MELEIGEKVSLNHVSLLSVHCSLHCIVQGIRQWVSCAAVLQVIMDAKEDSDYSELLQSLENVVMDLNDMENMIDNFEDSKPDALFEKV